MVVFGFKYYFEGYVFAFKSFNFRSNTSGPSIRMGEAGELDSPVSRFYRGKTVFITGATGFMGKVVLLKSHYYNLKIL